jgi:hypothetical protein
MKCGASSTTGWGVLHGSLKTEKSILLNKCEIVSSSVVNLKIGEGLSLHPVSFPWNHLSFCLPFESTGQTISRKNQPSCNFDSFRCRSISCLSGNGSVWPCLRIILIYLVREYISGQVEPPAYATPCLDRDDRTKKITISFWIGCAVSRPDTVSICCTSIWRSDSNKE